MQDVAILDTIFLPFEAEFPLVLHALLGTRFQEIVTSETFGPDESPLNIRMDFSRRVYGIGTLMDRPGPHLIFSDGKKGDIPQHVVGEPDQSVPRRFGYAEIFHENSGLFIIETAQLHFKFSRELEDFVFLRQGGYGVSIPAIIVFV